TVWLIDDRKDKLVFAASTALTEDNAQRLSELGGNISGLKAALSGQQYPVDIDESREVWVEELKRYNPEQFRQEGHRVCLPLTAGGNLLGLIALGDRVNGAQFTIQDFDILKCIGE